MQLSSRTGWVVGMRGLCAVLFGLIALFAPGVTVQVLTMLFGIYMLLDGIAALMYAMQHPKGGVLLRALLVEGIVGVAVGLVTLMWPTITLVIALYLIAFWAILTGLLEIFAGIELRRMVGGEWLLTLIGVLSLVCGAILLLFPVVSVMAAMIVVGIYALAAGGTLLFLSARLIRRSRAHHQLPAP